MKFKKLLIKASSQKYLFLKLIEKIKKNIESELHLFFQLQTSILYHIIDFLQS